MGKGTEAGTGPSRLPSPACVLSRLDTDTSLLSTLLPSFLPPQ